MGPATVGERCVRAVYNHLFTYTGTRARAHAHTHTHNTKTLETTAENFDSSHI